MPRRCPAARAFEGCAVRRLRPSWDFAVVRRCAGGVLQRGGPKGQQSLCEGCPVSCVGSWECSFGCLYLSIRLEFFLGGLLFS